MTRLSPRDPLTWIGFFQIGGVLLATYVIGGQAPGFLAAGPEGWAFFLLIAGFYTLSGVGAILLLRGSARGRQLTCLVQLPQLFQVRTTLVSWYITNGASLTLNWEPGWTGFKTGLGSQFTLLWGVSPVVSVGISYVAINFVPLGILYALLRSRKSLQPS